jgi:AbrB family looped-hinge helix DNA binding protein
MASMGSKTRLSSKGQIVIPKDVRERHGWGPGTELVIEDCGVAITLRAVQ